MKITVNVGISRWRASDFDVELGGGQHELPSDDVKLSAGLVRAIAAAAAAGVLEIVDADAKAAKAIDGVVQDDSDSLAVYEDAVASGVWLEGHLEDCVAQGYRRAERLTDELQFVDEDAKEAVLERIDLNAVGIRQAEARLAAVRKDD